MSEQLQVLRPLRIVNRAPMLPERGKIKIGEKGAVRKSQGGKDWQPPVKLDHFVITTLERDADGNFKQDAQAHEIFGEKPTRLPVRLLWNDPALNFQSRYAAYKGKTLWCTGNGQDAMREGKACPCPCERIEWGYSQPDKCKINGILSVIIDGLPGVGGVWKFRTTSFNTVDGLSASIDFLRGATGGQIAGVPLDLVVAPKPVSDPEGKQQTIYVVSLEFKGDMSQLADTAYSVAMRNVQAGLRIEQVEADARKMLPPPGSSIFGGEDAEDVRTEFYPHTQGKDAEKPATEVKSSAPVPRAQEPSAPPQGSGNEGSAPKMGYPEIKAWVSKAVEDSAAKGLAPLNMAWKPILEKLTRARGRGDLNADQFESLDMIYQTAKQNLEGGI